MTATYSNISSAAQFSADTLTIQGDGATLGGANGYPGLFAHSGVTTIENLTIENAVAEGGGAGLGGGLFVAFNPLSTAGPARVTLDNVFFTSELGRRRHRTRRLGRRRRLERRGRSRAWVWQHVRPVDRCFAARRTAGREPNAKLGANAEAHHDDDRVSQSFEHARAQQRHQGDRSLLARGRRERLTLPHHASGRRDLDRERGHFRDQPHRLRHADHQRPGGGNRRRRRLSRPVCLFGHDDDRELDNRERRRRRAGLAGLSAAAAERGSAAACSWRTTWRAAPRARAA